jgi:hypothetical protein
VALAAFSRRAIASASRAPDWISATTAGRERGIAGLSVRVYRHDAFALAHDDAVERGHAFADHRFADDGERL